MSIRNVWLPVGNAQASDSILIHNWKELAPITNLWKTAGFTPGNVSWYSVISSSLQIQWNQIHSERFSWITQIMNDAADVVATAKKVKYAAYWVVQTSD